MKSFCFFCAAVMATFPNLPMEAKSPQPQAKYGKAKFDKSCYATKLKVRGATRKTPGKTGIFEKSKWDDGSVYK